MVQNLHKGAKSMSNLGMTSEVIIYSFTRLEVCKTWSCVMP
jgi:hypothetical protein